MAVAAGVFVGGIAVAGAAVGEGVSVGGIAVVGSAVGGGGGVLVGEGTAAVKVSLTTPSMAAVRLRSEVEVGTV